MVGRDFLVVGGILLIVSGVAFAESVLLWREHVVELPAVAVRTLGRVEGVVSGDAPLTVDLPVAFHRQEHSLSCEIATLKMALGRYGASVSEDELIALLPFDLTPRRGDVWGNPFEGFVGDIDGTMMGTGYGVYADPIARIGLRYKRTEVLRGASVVDVAHHLAAGRPVIMWGYYGRGGSRLWRTSDGELVRAVNGEHTRVVTGFSGSVAAPTGFSLIDPISGPAYWSVQKFAENWDSLGRMGVVVYPHPRWVRAAGDGRVWEISEDGTTRHWVTDWATFVARGGFAEAIVTLDEKKLVQYKRGSDITL